MVTGLLLKNIDPTKLFLDRVPVQTQKAFLACIEMPILKKTEWYLSMTLWRNCILRLAGRKLSNIFKRKSRLLPKNF